MRESRKGKLIIDGDTLNVEIKEISISSNPTEKNNVKKIDYEIVCTYSKLVTKK